ncbi:MAG TPA: hypothetical protein VJG32_06925 [Anaerolineae bacterium]|nr:hypothetical protein [Anaerolineae bacterium]
MSKIGVHIMIGPRNGYGPFLKKIAQAGQTLAVVKCVDDFGPAKEAKDLMPKTLTVGRVNIARDSQGRDVDVQAFEPLKPDGAYRAAREVAEWYYGLVKPKWELNRNWIDVWETFNEFSAHWGWQSDFFLAMMDVVEPDGYVLSHYACSTGNPPNAAAARQMIPCLKAAKKRGHYLSLHEYGGVGGPIDTLKGTQPYHALRYRALYETILIPSQADARLIISECAQNGGYQFIGAPTFIEDFAWYDSELMKDSYVVGAAAWTLGRTSLWPNANIQDALPALADYIVAHPNTAPQPSQSPQESPVFGKPSEPEPTPPPTVPSQPVRPRGAPRTQYTRTYLLLPNEPTTPEGNQRLLQWIQAVVASGVLTRHRWTLGTSADDAAIGDLDRRNVIAINPETWPSSLSDFYATEYPGVTYNSIQAATPEELRDQLANMAFG